MEIRPILSALLRNKTGAMLVAVQVALSLAILANALHIVERAPGRGGAPERHRRRRPRVLPAACATCDDGRPQRQLATQKREAATLRAVPA